MAKKKPKVDVWERLCWECPQCCEANDGPSWLQRGDTAMCSSCDCEVVIDEHYADCRPTKFQGKKAKA